MNSISKETKNMGIGFIGGLIAYYLYTKSTSSSKGSSYLYRPASYDTFVVDSAPNAASQSRPAAVGNLGK